MQKTTESTPATHNNPVGVAVGVSAEEVEDIVAKAVSTATTVVRDELMKRIKLMICTNDFSCLKQWLRV